MLLLWLSLNGCGSATPPTPSAPVPPAPTIELEAPWRVIEQDEHSLWLQLADSPHGVRIDLHADGGAVLPGITPIWKGRTLHVDSDVGDAPLISLPFPKHAIQSTRLLVQGVDLVIRIEGPPLTEVTDHPDADGRPIVTQVRLRPRPNDWRIVVDGVSGINLPGRALAVSSGRTGWVVSSDWGTVQLDTDAPAWTSHLGARWRFETMPSIEETDPYPTTTLTWAGP